MTLPGPTHKLLLRIPAPAFEGIYFVLIQKRAKCEESNKSIGLLQRRIDLQQCSHTFICQTKPSVANVCRMFRRHILVPQFSRTRFIQNSRKCILHGAWLWAVLCVLRAPACGCMGEECVVAVLLLLPLLLLANRRVNIVCTLYTLTRTHTGL